MQARGVTEKAYVEQCKGGAEPTAAAPAPKPAEAPRLRRDRQPARARRPRKSVRPSGERTRLECRRGALLRRPTLSSARKARPQLLPRLRQSQRLRLRPHRLRPYKPMAHPRRKPRKIALRNGEPTRRACKRAVLLKKHMSSSAGQEVLHPRRPLRKASQLRPHRHLHPSRRHQPRPPAQAQPAQKPAPTTTAAPAPAPAQQPPAATGGATLEAGQFADDASAKARCPSDTVVWVNLPSKSLPLRRDQELRDHKAWRIHVRERSNRRREPRIEN